MARCSRSFPCTPVRRGNRRRSRRRHTRFRRRKLRCLPSRCRRTSSGGRPGPASGRRSPARPGTRRCSRRRAMRLPSSHCSKPSFVPSPQRGTQRAPVCGQVHPGSSWQLASQPSPALRVLVVAGLRAGDHAVAAGHGVDARTAGRRADPVRLGLAVGRATVAAGLVAVVAGLGRRVEHAVPARVRHARSGRAVAGHVDQAAEVEHSGIARTVACRVADGRRAALAARSRSCPCSEIPAHPPQSDRSQQGEAQHQDFTS